MNDKFNDLNIDSMAGAEIMSLLGISPIELQNPVTFQRIADIVSYLKNVNDKSFFVNKITVGKPVANKLDHVWSYIELLKNKDIAQSKLSDAENVVKQYVEKGLAGQMNDVDNQLAQTAIKMRDSLISEVKNIRDQQFDYEK